MSRTNFINQSTVITANWLNSVDATVINAIGDGGNAPASASEVKTNLALNNLNNTSDVNKPVSLATQNALDAKLTIPAFGTVGNILTSTGSSWVSAPAVVTVAASSVTYVPSGDVAATDVQAAITELDTEKLPRTGVNASAALPTGTTAQRDGTPVLGYLRYNTSTNGFEGYTATGWGSVGGGGSGQMLGNAAVKAINYNSQTIGENLTVASGTNAMSAGPITISNGFAVTVSDGCVWSII